jgi:hypothetical protein
MGHSRTRADDPPFYRSIPAVPPRNPPPARPVDVLLLSDGSSFLLLSDGTSQLILANQVDPSQ